MHMHYAANTRAITERSMLVQAYSVSMNLVLVLFIGSYTQNLVPYTLYPTPSRIHVLVQLCVRTCVRACAVVDRVCYASGLTV